MESAMQSNPDMQRCIQDCLNCHSVCLQMATNMCLETGGRHTEPAHFRLMLNCAEICQTAANFMLTGSELHDRVCDVCAHVCTACAESCEQLGDMQECVDACRRCAQSCEGMAASGTGGWAQRQADLGSTAGERH